LPDEKLVPVLITWDIDPDLWIPAEKRRWALNAAIDMCNRQGIYATFFFTAKSAELYLSDFEKMRAQGHEIGCHGLTHGDEEDYDRMAVDTQRRYIAEATERLQELVGDQVCAFRSPRVKTSAATLKLLAEQGYVADSSVCSQRADVISSNLINVGWVFAPRRAYRPNQDNAFRAGDVPIWEIPVSAMVLGPAAMRAFFQLLYTEARRTGKPIVYLAHPTEFLQWGDKGKRKLWKSHLERKYFTMSYIRANGLRLRNLLYRLEGEAMYSASQELLAYMASFPDVAFTTINEYVLHHLGQPSGKSMAKHCRLEQAG
jgi:peptidoglycan/xylan/chitin deacetylase (PgdA/CDA1 family)